MVAAGERDEAINEIKVAIAQYPGRAQFYNLLQTTYLLIDEGENRMK